MCIYIYIYVIGVPMKGVVCAQGSARGGVRGRDDSDDDDDDDDN